MPKFQAEGGQREYKPLPEGTYTCKITDVETRPRKLRDGKILAVRLEVYGGEFDGRTLWSYFTGASEFSRMFYRSLLRAAGAKNRDFLLGRHVRTLVSVEQYRDRLFNVVRRFWP